VASSFLSQGNDDTIYQIYLGWFSELWASKGRMSTAKKGQV
jgi:hypothetical protein